MQTTSWYGFSTAIKCLASMCCSASFLLHKKWQKFHQSNIHLLESKGKKKSLLTQRERESSLTKKPHQMCRTSSWPTFVVASVPFFVHLCHDLCSSHFPLCKRRSLIFYYSVLLAAGKEEFETFLSQSKPSTLWGVELQQKGCGPKGWNDVGGLHEVRRSLLETLQWPSKVRIFHKRRGFNCNKRMFVLFFVISFSATSHFHCWCFLTRGTFICSLLEELVFFGWHFSPYLSPSCSFFALQSFGLFWRMGTHLLSVERETLAKPQQAPKGINWPPQQWRPYKSSILSKN